MLGLSKFIKRKQEDIMMFSHVRCLISNLPTVSVEKAILNFLHSYNIAEDSSTLDTIRSTYNRMQSEYFEAQKTDGKEA